MKKYALIIFSVVWAGCSTVQELPEASSQGAQLFMNKCTQCHSWPHPQRHTAGEWDHYVSVMETHMKNKNLPFSPEDKKDILNYLHRNAR